jgi:hypothetical protein
MAWPAQLSRLGGRGQEGPPQAAGRWLSRRRGHVRGWGEAVWSGSAWAARREGRFGRTPAEARDLRVRLLWAPRSAMPVTTSVLGWAGVHGSLPGDAR